MSNSKLINKFPLFMIVVILGGIFIMQLFSGSDKYPTKNNIETNELNYSVKAPVVPDKIDFAGEKVPLNLFDVKESLDRELIVNSYYHSSTIQTLKRAKRFFPVIDSILKANEIPDDFKYLCVIESNLKNVTSPAGAKGYWQFMRSTGKEYGLEVNSYVDERLNLVKSTQAACEYLQNAKDKFGNWTLAAASYNMGQGGLQKRLNEQKVSSYYDLYLNPETARYVYRIIAMKIIMPQHDKYGFIINDSEKYHPLRTKTIVIDSTLNNLVDFSFSQGINYKMLKEFNPWLINKSLNNPSGKKYNILIPLEETRKCEPSVLMNE